MVVVLDLLLCGSTLRSSSSVGRAAPVMRSSVYGIRAHMMAS